MQLASADLGAVSLGVRPNEAPFGTCGFSELHSLRAVGESYSICATSLSHATRVCTGLPLYSLFSELYNMYVQWYCEPDFLGLTDTSLFVPVDTPAPVYLEPLCANCCQLECLTVRSEDTPYYMCVDVPTTCYRCKGRRSFNGRCFREYTTMDWYLTAEEANYVTAAARAKLDAPKRNAALGMTTFLEASVSSDPTGCRVRTLLNALPEVLALHSDPRLVLDEVPRTFFWYYCCGLRVKEQPVHFQVPGEIVGRTRLARATHVYRLRPGERERERREEAAQPSPPTGTETPSPPSPAPGAPGVQGSAPAAAASATSPMDVAVSTVDEVGGIPVRRFVGTMPPEAANFIARVPQGPVLTPSATTLHLPAGSSALPGVALTPDVTVQKIGPMLGNPVIYDHKWSPNRAHAAGVRMSHSAKFDPGEEMRRRLAEFDSKMLNRVFSKQNIIAAIKELPFFAELGPSGLSVDQFLRIFDDLSFLPERYANLKLEVTNKPGKSGRLVYDEGKERTVINSAAAWVFERIYFADKHFHRASVKHMPRDKALESIVEECKAPLYSGKSVHPTAFAEVDQTGFEYHETLQGDENSPHTGLLALELEILTRIVDAFSCVHVHKKCLGLILKEMAQCTIVAKGKPTPEIAEVSITDLFASRLRTREFFRTSGHRLTSAANHLQEFRATLCVFLSDPGAWLERWLNHVRDHVPDATGSLEPLPLRAIKGKSGLHDDERMVVFRMWFEGDDAGGRVSAAFIGTEGRAKALYAELGLEAKIDIAQGKGKPERLEFIGEHILVRNGCTVPGWHCMDVKRALVTLSANATGTPASQLSARFYSKAIGLVNMPFAAQLVGSVARYWEHAGTDDFCDGWQGTAVRTPHATLKAKFEERLRETSTKPSHDLLTMLKASLRMNVTKSEYAAACAYFTADLVWDPGKDDEYLFHLPKELRDSLVATYS